MKRNVKFYSLWLCFIILGVFILQLFIVGFNELFILNSNAWVEPWRFFSSIFLHGGVIHLIYNLFALALFGLILENLIGSKRFLIVFFVSGIIANLISINFYDSSLGASGAIFGVIGALVFIKPLMVVWAFGLPMPMFLAGILWGIGDLLGAIGFLTGNPIDNTGNIAHLSGMFIGFIFGSFYRKPSKKFRKNRLVINERSMRMWEDNYLR